jgi:uncharacterized protein DUF3352
MRRVRARLTALLAVLAIAALAAGCGGGGGGGGGSKSAAVSGGSAGTAATVVPASAPAFVSVDTDLGSSQWKNLLALAHRFPAFETLLAQGRTALAAQHIDFGNDVEPALGPEVAVSWLDFLNSSDFLVATKPGDAGKLDALLKKAQGSSTPAVKSDLGGGYVGLAEKQATLDAAKGATSHLADDPAFKEAIGELPSGSVASVYVSGPAVQQALTKQLSKSSTTLPIPTTTSAKLDWLSASLSPESDGIRLDGAAKVEPAPKIQAFKAELPSEFPSGALVYVGFAHLDAALRQLITLVGKGNSAFKQQLSQLEGVSGLSLDKDVISLFKNEAGLGVYASSTAVPTIVYALKIDDAQQVAKVLDRLSALAQLAGTKVSPATVPGVANAKELKVSTYSIFLGTVGGKLVFSNTTAGLTSLGGSGPKLADDAAFKAAKDGASMPDETDGFVYANLKDGLSEAFEYAGRAGTKITDQVKTNTAPLQSLLLYATQDGAIFKLGGFAGIK